jgi:hypothetical protein
MAYLAHTARTRFLKFCVTRSPHDKSLAHSPRPTTYNRPSAARRPPNPPPAEPTTTFLPYDPSPKNDHCVKCPTKQWQNYPSATHRRSNTLPLCLKKCGISAHRGRLLTLRATHRVFDASPDPETCVANRAISMPYIAHTAPPPAPPGSVPGRAGRRSSAAKALSPSCIANQHFAGSTLAQRAAFAVSSSTHISEHNPHSRPPSRRERHVSP